MADKDREIKQLKEDNARLREMVLSLKERLTVYEHSDDDSEPDDDSSSSSSSRGQRNPEVLRAAAVGPAGPTAAVGPAGPSQSSSTGRAAQPALVPYDDTDTSSSVNCFPEDNVMNVSVISIDDSTETEDERVAAAARAGPSSSGTANVPYILISDDEDEPPHKRAKTSQ